MFGGHVVLAVFIGFIAAAADSAFYVWGSITIISIAMSLAISLLELLVAFLQAYIFAFLTTLFINMSLHQH
jgi:F-type H+-transporting ATPase subunit a